MMEIETKTASLETFSVTIQALHVNGKQMTLAVFRQLPVSHEETSDQLWGSVKYSIKDEGDFWLVFSSNGKLFRRRIDIYRPRLQTFSIQRDLEKAKSKRGSWGYENGDEEYKKKIEDDIREFESELDSAEQEHAQEMAYFEYSQKLLETLPQLFIAV
jgi:hypothetical protein